VVAVHGKQTWRFDIGVVSVDLVVVGGGGGGGGSGGDGSGVVGISGGSDNDISG
jgi:hypothetical protein